MESAAGGPGGAALSGGPEKADTCADDQHACTGMKRSTLNLWPSNRKGGTRGLCCEALSMPGKTHSTWPVADVVECDMRTSLPPGGVAAVAFAAVALPPDTGGVFASAPGNTSPCEWSSCVSVNPHFSTRCTPTGGLYEVKVTFMHSAFDVSTHARLDVRRICEARRRPDRSVCACASVHDRSALLENLSSSSPRTCKRLAAAAPDTLNCTFVGRTPDWPAAIAAGATTCTSSSSHTGRSASIAAVLVTRSAAACTEGQAGRQRHALATWSATTPGRHSQQ